MTALETSLARGLAAGTLFLDDVSQMLDVGMAAETQMARTMAAWAIQSEAIELGWQRPTVCWFDTADERAAFLARFLPRGTVPVRTPRSRLTATCFRLIRQGVGARDLPRRMREANAQLDAPLSDADLDSLIVWVVERHLEEAASAQTREGRPGARHA